MFNLSILDSNPPSADLSDDSIALNTAIASGSVLQGYDPFSTQTVYPQLSPYSCFEVVSELKPLEECGATELSLFAPQDSLIPISDRSMGTTGEASYDALIGIVEDAPLVGNVNPDALTSAHDFGILSGSLSFSDLVGNGDANDLFRFELDRTSNFSLTFSELSGNADVQLIQDINGNGSVESDEVLDGSYTEGITPEVLNKDLAPGVYYIQLYPYSDETNYTLSLTANELAGRFNLFSFTDAAGDSTASSVFEGGAIRFSYGVENAPFLSSVQLEAWGNGEFVANLGTWSEASLSNQLVHLAQVVNLTGGNYNLRTLARTTDGQEFYSPFQMMSVLSQEQISGTLAGETLNYSAGLQTGTVVFGRGGTDTLNLQALTPSDILSFNGQSLTTFELFNSTTSQSIFAGTAFDYLLLADGREIYFQGIENLRFADGSTLELQVRPNDTNFGFQWNLHVSDVPSAWRITQGSNQVLLASLDTGILTAQNAEGDIVDISTSRLITDATDDDNSGNYGHGHSAISIMASDTNNGEGIAGINWNSQVMVHDVYGRTSQNYLFGRSGVTLMAAIEETISYARTNNLRVVFQGGIQGENWLTSTYGRKFAYHYEQGTLLLSSWFCIRDSMEVNASCQL